MTQPTLNAEALESFTTYFVKNYPGPDTIIHDPKWHAPRIFRAAVSAYLASLPPVDAKPVASDLVERLRSLRAGAKKHFDDGSDMWFFELWHALDEAAAAIIALQGERDEKSNQLGDLLAIIHRDGGQYQETHGDKKAVDDAHLIWADLVRRAEAAEAEVARLKDELTEAHRVINGVLTFKIEHDASCDHPHICECGADAVRDMARSFRDGQKTGEKG